jgi:S1-C subfamily serine protease
MRARFSAVLLLLLTTGFIAGVVLTGRMSSTQTADAAPPITVPAPQATSPARPLPAGPLPDLSSVAERALQVSANITSTTVQRFNDPIQQLFTGQGQRSFQQQSAGSGVVVSDDGYVLTNTHVIGDANAAVRVTLPSGEELPGRIIGIDSVSDLAVVKVESKGLQTLPWGDSDKVRIAEWVLAVGNPFQLGGTVTLGIVSTVSRSGEQVGAYSDFIQTDAAINPGNSGGALINQRGELIGINTMIYSESGGNQGIGFAIPSKLAQRIMNELKENGSVTWGSIGPVNWVTLDRRTARRNGLADVDGVLVYQLWEGAGARAGLRPGDIVLAVNGQPVTAAQQVDRLITGAKVGSTMKLDVVKRDGRKTTLNVIVAKRGDEIARRR